MSKLQLAINEVGIMEDDPTILGAIEKVLKRLGYKVHKLSSADEVVELAVKKHVHQYILDVNMGRDRKLEGLKASARLKKESTDIFVGLISSVSSKAVLNAVETGKADYYRRKTPDCEQDVALTVSHMLEFTSTLNRKKMEKEFPSLVINNVIDCDSDFEAYQRLAQDDTWMKNNVGKYVVLVNGNVFEMGPNLSELLHRAHVENPDGRLFYMLIEHDPEPIPLVTGLSTLPS